MAHNLHMICIHYNFTSGPKLSNPRCHPSLRLHPKGSRCLCIRTYRNRGFTQLCWGEILVLRCQNVSESPAEVREPSSDMGVPRPL